MSFETTIRECIQEYTFLFIHIDRGKNLAFIQCLQSPHLATLTWNLYLSSTFLSSLFNQSAFSISTLRYLDKKSDIHYECTPNTILCTVDESSLESAQKQFAQYSIFSLNRFKSFDEIVQGIKSSPECSLKRSSTSFNTSKPSTSAFYCTAAQISFMGNLEIRDPKPNTHKKRLTLLKLSLKDMHGQSADMCLFNQQAESIHKCNFQAHSPLEHRLLICWNVSAKLFQNKLSFSVPYATDDVHAIWIHPPEWLFVSVYHVFRTVCLKLPLHHSADSLPGVSGVPDTSSITARNFWTDSSYSFHTLYSFHTYIHETICSFLKQQQSVQTLETKLNDNEQVQSQSFEVGCHSLVSLYIDHSSGMKFKCPDTNCFGFHSYMSQSEFDPQVYVCQKCEKTFLEQQLTEQEQEDGRQMHQPEMTQRMELAVNLSDATYKIKTFLKEWQVESWIKKVSKEQTNITETQNVIDLLMKDCLLKRFVVRLKSRVTLQTNKVTRKDYIQIVNNVQYISDFSQLSEADQMKILSL